MARELVTVDLRWKGRRIANFTSQVDPDDADDVQALFRDAIVHDRDSGNRKAPEYEIEVRRKRNGAHLLTYVGRSS